MGSTGNRPNGRSVGVIPIKSRYQSLHANWGNYAIIALCVLVYIWECGAKTSDIKRLCFDPKTFNGLLTSLFLHADIFHLLGNMLVLNVFGKAIVDKLGNVTYIALYILMGALANAFFAIFDTRLALGASGAISGIIAMSLILMPFVDIKTIVWLMPPVIFDMASFWIAGIWFIFDVWNSSNTGGGIAYQAHVGGFLAGIIISLVLISTKRIAYNGTEKSLLEIFFGMKPAADGQRMAMQGRCCDNCGAALAKEAKRCEHCGISLTRFYRKGA